MATRQTFNRRVETRGPAGFAEFTTDAPAFETEAARQDMVGPLRKANVAIPSSAVALSIGGVDTDAGTGITAMMDGQVIGLSWAWTAAPTHTAGTVQATLGGTASGDVVTIDGAVSGVKRFATPVAFVEGNLLGAKVTTDANFLPANDDLSVWLLVRWNP